MPAAVTDCWPAPGRRRRRADHLRRTTTTGRRPARLHPARPKQRESTHQVVSEAAHRAGGRLQRGLHATEVHVRGVEAVLGDGDGRGVEAGFVVEDVEDDVEDEVDSDDDGDEGDDRGGRNRGSRGKNGNNGDDDTDEDGRPRKKRRRRRGGRNRNKRRDNKNGEDSGDHSDEGQSNEGNSNDNASDDEAAAHLQLLERSAHAVEALRSQLGLSATTPRPQRKMLAVAFGRVEMLRQPRLGSLAVADDPIEGFIAHQEAQKLLLFPCCIDQRLIFLLPSLR